MGIKKNICLIYTGGTIGMVADDKGILRPPESAKDFLEFAPDLKHIANIEFIELMGKDSTNIVPDDWRKIAQAIYDRKDQFDGFVIAHGTDTMHFSASAVAFALGNNLNFPVVFTGAQTTPDISHGDARVNLLRATMVAIDDGGGIEGETELREVVIVFGDYIFRGVRTQKKDEKRFDAFESPAIYPIGDITEKIIFHPTARRKKIGEKVGNIDFQPFFADDIIQLGLIPGLKPEILEPILNVEKCQGIVLQSFGAGNVPNEGEFAFKNFIERAVSSNIPVIITSQFPANSTLETHYEPGVQAIEADAIPTGNMTSSAATVKFRWVLAQLSKERKEKKPEFMSNLKQMMGHPYVQEHD